MSGRDTHPSFALYHQGLRGAGCPRSAAAPPTWVRWTSFRSFPRRRRSSWPWASPTGSSCAHARTECLCPPFVSKQALMRCLPCPWRHRPNTCACCRAPRAPLQGVSNLCDHPQSVRVGRRVVARSRIDPTLPSGDVDAARSRAADKAQSISTPSADLTSTAEVACAVLVCRLNPLQHPSSTHAQALRQLAEKREPAYSVDAAWLAAARPGLVITQAVCGVGPGESSSAVAAALSEAGLLSAGSETTTLARTARDADTPNHSPPPPSSHPAFCFPLNSRVRGADGVQGPC